MDLPFAVSNGICPNDHQAVTQMKKTWEALLPFLGTILMILGGCTHVPSSISVAPAVDNISAVQGNLSAVDSKSVVIEQWLKTQK